MQDAETDFNAELAEDSEVFGYLKMSPRAPRSRRFNRLRGLLPPPRRLRGLVALEEFDIIRPEIGL